MDLKLPDICFTGEEKRRENLTQETYPDWGSNLGPLRDRRACYRLLHCGGLVHYNFRNVGYFHRISGRRHDGLPLLLLQDAKSFNMV